MLKDRSKYLDESANLRALLGEIKDPKELYLRTVDQMSQTLSANQLYRQFAQKTKLILMEPLQSLTQWWQTISLLQEKNFQKIKQAFLTNNGYTRLGDVTDELNITDAQKKLFGGKYGALTGDFVP